MLYPISYPEQLATLFDFTDGRVTFVSAIKIIIKRTKGLGSSLQLYPYEKQSGKMMTDGTRGTNVKGVVAYV